MLTSLFSDLTESAKHSAAYLKNTLTPVEYQEGLSTLTLVGQAMTFHSVELALNALKDIVSVRSIGLHALDGRFGDSVVVVQCDPVSIAHDELALRLEAVALSLHINVGLQKEQPSLSEPGLLVMDMDSTLISIECIDEIAKLAGVGEEVANVTARAMRGEIAFNDSLIHRVACLKGVSVDKLLQIRNGIPLMPGVQNLTQTLAQNGWKLAIASGGFTYFADYLRDRLGLDVSVSNTLGEEDGTLTGEVIGDIINAQVKADTVRALSEQWNIPNTQTVALGDGANDLVMMEEAALGVACHGKPVVNQKADVAIRFGGLHNMLYFMK